VTFDDIRLCFYAVGARGSDGQMDVFGMDDGLQMRFAGRDVRPVNCPIVDAVIAGMAQPFYVTPPCIGGEQYFDGGAAYYDIELFAAGMEEHLHSLLSIHVVGPPDYTFGFPERPDVVKIVLDTHNWTFPEERRRMTALTNLMFENEALQQQAKVYRKAKHTLPMDAEHEASDMELSTHWRRAPQMYPWNRIVEYKGT
jgi:hypothetical protein